MPGCLNLVNTTGGSGSGVGATAQGPGGTAILGDAKSTATGSVGAEGRCEGSSCYGVYGGATNTSATQTFGVSGTNNATGNFSPVGGNGYGSGVYGSSAGALSAGVYGTSTGASSAGMLGYSPVAAGVGVSGQATGTGGSWGVFGNGTAAVGGGVIGLAFGSGGTGVAGQASNTVTGSVGVYGSGNVGVWGTSPSGVAVSGQSTSGYGLYSIVNNAMGVYGSSGGSGTSVAGVYAYNPGAGHYAGYLNGNIQVIAGLPYCTGFTKFTNNSDIRLKQNVEPVSGALDTLLKLHGVTFEWREPKEQGNHEGTQRGFIAQEVETVLPEWVGVDAKGFKTLNLTGIEALTVESLRVLKARNEELRSRVSMLRVARRPIASAVDQLGIGFGLCSIAGAILIYRRKEDPSSKAGA